MQTSTETDREAANRVPAGPARDECRSHAMPNSAKPPGVDCGARVSFDPMRPTDRYRLVMPYSQLGRPSGS